MSAQSYEKRQPVHEIRNGRECHCFLEKRVVGGQTVWICDCGEMRDRFGHPL